MNLEVLEAELAAARALRARDEPAAERAMRRILGENPDPELVAALEAWASEQRELARSAAPQEAVAQAELRALDSLMSSHFVYSALSSIHTLVRTAPKLAHDLLLDFADFTRYSLRRSTSLTTLADELSVIHRYLALEQARLGGRLTVTLRVAPEALPVRIPSLCLQPLVQNAVQHGIAARPGPGHIRIEAIDVGTDVVISVDDDGVGMDVNQLCDWFNGEEEEPTGISLRTINERLQRVYGEFNCLIIETAAGSGMKVIMRIPK